MKSTIYAGLMATALGAFAVPATAQQGGFDPRQPCGQVLASTDLGIQTMVAAWTFGYLASSQDDPRPVDPQNNQTLLGNLQKACAANPQSPLIDLVGGSKKPTAATPGSEAEARAVLSEFLKPGADLWALTQAIMPKEADVRVVYAEPLATWLWASYSEQLGPGVSFGPKQGQTALLIVHATTRDLVEGKAVLREFPGGYKDVLKYFKTDVPIVRFKFVEPGETLGLAFDGLVHVNGRWVLMPKPWRSIQK